VRYLTEKEQEKTMNDHTSDGEGSRDSWGGGFGAMERHLKWDEDMTVTFQDIPYDVDEETDDEYRDAKQLKEKWLVFRDCKETLMKYWMAELCKKYAKSSGKEEHAAFWRPHLSTLADLYMAKDDAEGFVRHHGVLYRWEWRFSQVANSDSHNDSVTLAMFNGKKARKEAMREMKESEQGTYATLQRGWRYYLQILNAERKGKMAKWTDWIYLAKSEYITGNRGLRSSVGRASGCQPRGFESPRAASLVGIFSP